MDQVSPETHTRQGMLGLRSSVGVEAREYVATAILLQHMLQAKFNRPFDRTPATDHA